MRARTISGILVLVFGVSALLYMYTSQFTIPRDKIEKQVKTMLVEDKILETTVLLKGLTNENQIDIVECKEEYPFLFCSGYITAQNQKAKFGILFQKSIFSDTYQYKRGVALESKYDYSDSDVFLFKGVTFTLPTESYTIETRLFLNARFLIGIGYFLLVFIPLIVKGRIDNNRKRADAAHRQALDDSAD